MGKFKTVLQNLATNFVLGFVLGTVLRDRETGVRAGLVLGLIGAVGSLVLYDRLDESDLEEFGAEEESISVEGTEA